MIVFFHLILILLQDTTDALRINFNPSQSLIDLSLYSQNFSLKTIILEILRTDELWPLLLGFEQAQFFNFGSVFNEAVGLVKCKELLSIVSDPKFPVSLISADILMEKSACFKLLPLDRLRRLVNPLESSNFIPSNWNSDQLSYFIKSAFQSNDPMIKWNNLCSNSVLFDHLIEHEDVDFFWEVLGYNCLKKLPEESVINFIKKVAQYMFFNNTVANIINGNNLRKNPLSTLVPRFLRSTSEGEILFSIEQVMKVIFITATSTKYVNNEDITNLIRIILSRYLIRVERHKDHKFPMRRKLIFIIKSFLAPQFQEFEKISTVFLDILVFCKVRIRGSWFINVLTLWNHFRLVSVTYNPQPLTFIEPFLNLFFDSNSNVSDICLLLNFIHFQIPFYPIRQVLDNLNNLELAKQVYIECLHSHLLPVSYLTTLVPLSFKLSYIFKHLRKINCLRPTTIEIYYHFSIDIDWIPVLNIVNEFFLNPSDTPIIPLNYRIIYNYYEINLSYLLKMFLDTLLKPSDWWIIKAPLMSAATSSDKRPVLVPSLNLPPQIMEIIGYFLACALATQTKVPFKIDYEYFHLVDKRMTCSVTERFTIISSFYPETLELRTSKQVYRIMKCLDRSKDEIIKNIPPNSFYLKPFDEEPKEVYNSKSDFFKIASEGSNYLRLGLKSVMPIDVIKPKLLYELLFK